MNGTEDSGRENAPPPPPRDRTTLWAVGGAVALFIVIVAAALMIKDEPREEGAPQPSPKGRRAGRKPVAEFNAALRRGKRNFEAMMGSPGIPIGLETVEELSGTLADLDALTRIALRLSLTADERELLVRWIEIAREMTSAWRDALAETAEIGGVPEKHVQKALLAMETRLTSEMMELGQHPAAKTLLESLESIGVERGLVEDLLRPIVEAATPAPISITITTPVDGSGLSRSYQYEWDFDESAEEPPVKFDAEIIVE